MAKQKSKKFLTRHPSIHFFFAFTSVVGAPGLRAARSTRERKIHPTFWRRQACLPVREQSKLAARCEAVVEHPAAARGQHEAAQQKPNAFCFRAARLVLRTPPRTIRRFGRSFGSHPSGSGI